MEFKNGKIINLYPILSRGIKLEPNTESKSVISLTTDFKCKVGTKTVLKDGLVWLPLKYEEHVYYILVNTSDRPDIKLVEWEYDNEYSTKFDLYFFGLLEEEISKQELDRLIKLYGLLSSNPYYTIHTQSHFKKMQEMLKQQAQINKEKV